MMPPGGSLYARVVTRLVLVLLVTGTTLVLAAWFYAKLAREFSNRSEHRAPPMWLKFNGPGSGRVFDRALAVGLTRVDAIKLVDEAKASRLRALQKPFEGW